MPYREKTSIQHPRLLWLSAIFGFLVCCMVARLFYLHVFARDFLRSQGDARTLRTVLIPSYRGLIMDRRGTPLAVSTPMTSVWSNPQLFTASATQLDQLSKMINQSPLEIIKKNTKNKKNKNFIYLQRGIPPNTAQQIQALRIKGLGLQREFRRFYPSGASVAQVVGFTNIDDQGQAGLELTYNSVLKPTPGKKRVLEDQLGHWIKDIDNIQVPLSGSDLHLSIDLRIQTLALKELTESLNKYKAPSGTLIMLDVKTGEILAMVSAPSFNPNNIHERKGSHLRNKALVDQLEPGSTMKIFSFISALESGLFTPATLIDTHPGTYKVGNNSVRDPHNFGKLSLTDILVKSSNVGTSKVILNLTPEHLLNTFKRLGLGVAPLTEFIGEASGYFPKVPKNPFTQATISWGYGIAVTPLQLINAYAIIARQGKQIPLHLIKQDPSNIPKTQRIISEQVAQDAIHMLEKSGAMAQIHGFKTAGKSGTTRLLGAQGYDAKRHRALFAGFTPVSDPRLATLVIIDDPSDQYYYGSQVALPVYTNVVSKALHMLNITPDNPERE